MSRPEDKMVETQSGRFINVVEPSEVTEAQAAALTSTDVAAADAVASVAAPTKAEFDAVVALANETKADFNALRADVVAIRVTLNNLIDQLNG